METACIQLSIGKLRCGERELYSAISHIDVGARRQARSPRLVLGFGSGTRVPFRPGGLSTSAPTRIRSL